jgi:hypothetical protein
MKLFCTQHVHFDSQQVKWHKVVKFPDKILMYMCANPVL